MEPEQIFLNYLEDLEEGRGPAPEDWLRQRVDCADPKTAEFERLFARHRGLLELAHLRGTSARSAARLALGIAEPARILSRLAERAVGGTRYRRRAEIARGGMGAILEVWDEDLHRQAAMKILLQGQGGAADSGETASKLVARFLEEAQITGQLSHPGIVPVHELGLDENGQLFFTMQLIKGQHLGEIIQAARQRRDGWNPTRVVGVLQRACEALAFAHNKGVLHRDLKPANIMVGRFGEAYVMDWGLARVEGQADAHDLRPQPTVPAESLIETDRRRRPQAENSLLTLDGEVVGTPSYMSPEQARGELAQMGARSDVYSMGAVLYELLTGRAPYTSPGIRQSPLMIWRQVTEGPPPPIASLDREAPPELVAIAERAMQRVSEQRYGSMEELSNDLRNYLENRVVRAYAAGPLAQLRKWVSRNPLAAGALATVALVLLTSGFVLAQIERRRGREGALRLAQVEVEGLLRLGKEGFSFDPTGLTAVRAWLARTELLLGQFKERGAQTSPPTGQTSTALNGLEAALTDLVQRRQIFEEDLVLARIAARELPEDWRLTRRNPTREMRLIEAELARLTEVESSLQLALQVARWEALPPESAGREAGLLRARLRLLADSAGVYLREQEFEVRLAAACGPLTAEEQVGWSTARAALSVRCGLPDMELEPVLGLVPIGIDPHSGLPEFWHRASGDRPQRNAAGLIDLQDGDGMVLIALPPGEFGFGDPDSVGKHPYRLSLSQLVYLSKYELTTGQYLRLTGETPSTRTPIMQLKGCRRFDWTVPVESVTHERATVVLARFALELPSEAVWEYAAVCGGQGPFWFGGQEAASGQENFLGEEIRLSIPTAEPYFRQDDGWVELAPVDAGQPNPFGFYQVHGNLAELTSDRFASDLAVYTVRDPASLQGLGLDRTHQGAWVLRGGSWGTPPEGCTGFARSSVTPRQTSSEVGIRPILIPRQP